MKQLIQNFKTGDLYVEEVPVPSLSEGMVLVENEYSLISAGTERSTVRVAKAGLLGKARQRPDLVAQVMQNLRKEGLKATIQKVRTKLDSLKALGYSTCGKVILSMDTEGKFKPGDRVVCAGQDYASHAEIISVPQNLVARVPENVDAREAAFTTLGSIALQGVRQADLKIGERVAVIGLGLLGQITCQLLKANGCKVMGIDLSDSLVKLAASTAAELAVSRENPNLLRACENFTLGYGFDSVIITAAAPSNDPIELAGEICRKKGRIVIVGAVKMDIPRDPHYYRKELDIRMSCSYGPGRYDQEYEENGQDYPFAYVRWTEQRNMEAFLDLLSRKSIDMNPLISHVFDIGEAEKAYDIITGRDKIPHMGILLRYSENNRKRNSRIEISKAAPAELNVGFIGAGSFAQSYLIPNVKSSGAGLATVVTSRGITARNVGDKFRFHSCSSDPADVLNDPSINVVFIATPHHTHADLVVQSLKSGKNVFVEKPLAITRDQLNSVIRARSEFNHPLMVGFNRRFAPVSQAIRNELGSAGEPMVIHMRVNAGFIPLDHWTQQPHIGGDRIVGEACHFVDLMQFFTGSEPVRVFAQSMKSSNSRFTGTDHIAVVINFNDGSVGNLVYTANGDKSLPKENIEIYCGGAVGIIHDFRAGFLHRNGRVSKLSTSGKGHKEEVRMFLDNIRNGKDSPIDFRSICLTTLTTFCIQESLVTGLPQEIKWDE